MKLPMNETSYFQITSYEFFLTQKRVLGAIYETLGTHPPFPFFCKAPCRSRNRWRPPPHRSNPGRLAHHRQRRETLFRTTTK